MLIASRVLYYVLLSSIVLYSPADVCDQTQRPEGGSQRNCKFRLRGTGEPSAVGILDARGIPSAHVSRQRVRTLSRDPRRHAAHTGRSKRRRRIPRVLRFVRGRIRDVASIPTSMYNIIIRVIKQSYAYGNDLLIIGKRKMSNASDIIRY